MNTSRFDNKSLQVKEEQQTQMNSFVALLGLAGLVLFHQACAPPESSEQGSSIIEEVETSVMVDLLTGVGSNVILPALTDFETEVIKLEDSLQELENAYGTEQQTTAFETTREQWKTTMQLWQELEVMQIGPAGSELKVIGGQDIRDSIYSWPTVNTCRVDQNTAAENWNSTTYYEDNLVNAYGLEAIEHMLFGTTETNCPSQVNPIADGSWASLGEDGIISNRILFSRSLLEEIKSQVDLLQTTWSPEEGNFAEHLLAGEDSPYESQTVALNAIYNSLFYLETATKDRKLAQPLGYRDCTEERCPDDFEGILSQTSLSSVIGNLRGFKKLFMGGEGAGIDDLLAELGHGDLSEEIIRDTDETIEKFEELESYVHEQNISITDLLTNEPERIENAYESLALVTTNLKNDLATVLQMEIPREAAGDND